MDCGPNKFYHKHAFNSRAYIETFFSDKPDMVFAEDSLKFPMMNFQYMFSSGFVKGNILIDLSIASIIHHLYSVCDIYKDIIILKLTENCNMETSRWKDSRTGAFRWTHASAHVSLLDGQSAQIEDKDQQLKASISHVISCDFDNENITYPVVLPLADCITTLGIIEAISEDEDDYMGNLEKISKLLKPGGHLMLIGLLNASYYVIGGEKFHMFTCDESFVRNALCKLGFVIDYCAVKRRRNESTAIDYKAIMFLTACKTK
ncbi:indolethylamine N-methyltransferase-like [Hyperolius riggenbachi]|uniref:indolethylamine N-methyltransferase-like n=1 Tax=Hyperolius riggenbachi TaxID=752182 RepID=UPI0035A38B6D